MIFTREELKIYIMIRRVLKKEQLNNFEKPF